MDVFYEESAIVHNSDKKTRRYNIVTGISLVFLALAILWVFIGFGTIRVNELWDWISWGVIALWLFASWFLLRKVLQILNKRL